MPARGASESSALLIGPQLGGVGKKGHGAQQDAAEPLAAAGGDDATAWRSPLYSLRLVALGEPGDRPWANVLLLLVPVALLAWMSDWPSSAVFLLSLASMVPIAER